MLPVRRHLPVRLRLSISLMLHAVRLLLPTIRLLLLVLLERSSGSFFLGRMLLGRFLFLQLYEVAFEAFEISRGGEDEMFGFVGGFEGFEHGADLR